MVDLRQKKKISERQRDRDRNRVILKDYPTCRNVLPEGPSVLIASDGQ